MNNLNVNSALLKANLFVKKGKNIEAKKLYIEILKKFSKNKRALEGLKNLNVNSKEYTSQDQINKLLELYQSRDMNNVISFTNELIEDTYPNFLVWNLKGAANLALKNYQQAEIAFKESINLNPNNAEIYNNLGVAFKEQEKFTDALESYKKAISINQKFTEAYNNIGILYQKMKKYEQSISYFEKAIHIKSDYSNGYNNLGMSLNKIGKLDKAILNFKKAIIYNKNHFQAYCNLGINQIHNKEYEKAIINLKEASAINPQYEVTYNNLGIAFRETGRFDDAISNFKKAISLKPNYFQAYNNIATLFHKTGDLNNAEINYKKALAINPNYDQAKFMLDVLLGNKIRKTPKAYVEDLFDNFADSFDYDLKVKLSYNTPSIIKKMVLSFQENRKISSILDLGCGTGLVGEELRKHVDYIEGIDLSTGMLREASKKNIYNKLTQRDIIEYLMEANLNFDYFIASDVFIYVGDLSRIFNYIKKRNKKNGKLIFSTEHYNGTDFKIGPNGRYLHSKEYIERLSKEYNFTLLLFEKIQLRKEKKKSVVGGLYTLAF